MTFHLAVLPKKQKYDCVTEDDYVYVRSKSRPLTRFCDTNYDVTMHRHTAIRAVLTTAKVLPQRGTFEGKPISGLYLTSLFSMSSSGLLVVCKSSLRALCSMRVTFSRI